MSKHNKVNKDSYVQRGRLTPDAMARERINRERVAERARHQEKTIGKATERSGGRASIRPRNVREE
jgi:hypothetical protein